MGETNALRFGDEAEQSPVSVEAPRPTLFDNLKVRLIVPIKELVGDFALGGLVCQLDREGAVPLDIDDGHKAVWQNAAN